MRNQRPSRRSRERGVVLLFCLIILVVLLAGGVAVVRSMNTSLFSAGNLAFKRDLVNQGEQAAAEALALFRTGALKEPGADRTSAVASNYSAVQLATNDNGIPLALLKKDEYGKVATKLIEKDDDQVKIWYVIDRLCNDTGIATKSNCIFGPSSTEVRGGDIGGADRPPPPNSLIYRLSIRVDGPRQTQVFLQSSFTKPE